MQTIKRNLIKLTTVFVLVAALFGSGLSSVTTAAAACSPTVSFSLWAKTGTATLYGSTTVNIWGYAANSGDPAGLPGPVLDVPEGACVGVTLTNNLSATTSLHFQGQSMVPDLTGVAPSGSKTYTFTATKPGTFVYEAGLMPNTQHQAAMGLYGALIVRPSTPNQAYGSASTAYDEESVVVLSEYDTAVAASPATFDMRKFAPKYFLINGKAYPGTANISVTAGNKVLLRYVNAGLQSHAMSMLGFSQNVIATDGNPFTHPHMMASETIAPGQTLDTLITAPASVADGSKFALYDANMLLRNNTGLTINAGLGGMLTFLNVTGGTSTGGPDNPLLSAITLTPNPSTGAVSVALSFTANDTTTGNSNITAAEYWIDAGIPTPITVVSPAPVVTLNATIASGLSTGTHVVSVRAQDALGNWSVTGNINLVVDNVGPTTGSLALTPNPSSGAVSVTLSFIANDSATGNSNVTAAEYWVDAGAPQSVSIGLPAPVKTLNATIASGLTPGSHTVHARSQDALGNWGAEATITLVVDNLGPITSGVSSTPNPNNGTMGLSTSIQAVRVTASFSDVGQGGSNLSNAEGFLDAPATTGTGFVFIANDGNFNSPAESGFADIPLVVVAALSNGSHPICVHSKDAAGNWGAFNCTHMLVIDKLPPTLSGLTLNPSVTSTSAVAINVTANDTATGNNNITAGEYFIDAGGAVGTGTAMTPAAASPSTTLSATISAGTVTALTGGNHTIYVRAKDALGNWSALSNATLVVDRTAPTISNVTVSPDPTNNAATITATITAADTGGSTLNGGQYWLDGTTTPPALPTAFAGTTSPITVSGINISAFTGGTHILRVRVKDAVGNYSAVFSRTFTVITDFIFIDGFESSPFPANWSSRSTTNTTRLDRSAAAALNGSSFGMQAQGNNTNYVQFNFGTLANPAAANYDARFYFDPNSNGSGGHDIFAGATSTAFSTQLFHVRYRTSLGLRQVQIQAGGTGNPSWFTITDAPHYLEVLWHAGSAGTGTLALYVDGVLAQSLTHSSTGSVRAVRLGSVTSGGAGAATLEYFDAFSSKRTISPLIGP